MLRSDATSVLGLLQTQLASEVTGFGIRRRLTVNTEPSWSSKDGEKKIQCGLVCVCDCSYLAFNQTSTQIIIAELLPVASSIVDFSALRGAAAALCQPNLRKTFTKSHDNNDSLSKVKLNSGRLDKSALYVSGYRTLTHFVQSTQFAQ